jgi:hypothetical protein
MGIYRIEDTIAWNDGCKIICTACGGESEKAIPCREDDFDEGDDEICVVCGERVF